MILRHGGYEISCCVDCRLSSCRCPNADLERYEEGPQSAQSVSIGALRCKSPPDKADDNWSEAARFLGQSYKSATKYQLPQLAWTFTSQQHIYEICRDLE